jgi:hypothetical protein
MRPKKRLKKRNTVGTNSNLSRKKLGFIVIPKMDTHFVT